MSIAFPEPDAETDPRVVIGRQLAFARASMLAKIRSLDDDVQRVSRVPSGWSPLELLAHVVHMERRWFLWGFLGEQVADPWGDHEPESPGVWRVPSGTTVDDLAAELDAVARRTEHVLATAPLHTLAVTGGRFDHDPPSLTCIALHVLAEYTRHLGHLDVAVELAGGHVGE